MENNSWTNEEIIHQHSTYSGNSSMPLNKPVLINNTGIAMIWTPEEQTILENALARYPLDSCVSSLRYAKIALELPEKTTKDVAMRCRWIKELGRVKVENSIPAPHDAVTNELLNQNEQLSEQIIANLTSSSSSKVLDNLPLFNQIYGNIMELFNKLDENVPDKMKQMPPLREMLNDDIFHLILPQIYLNQHE